MVYAITASTETSLTEITACNGLLIVLVGPSGVGKNTIMDSLLAGIPQLRQMPTATTRPMRPGEAHGVQHFFISVEQFRQLIAEGALLEHQEVIPGKFYGVPRKELEDSLRDRHELLIADIEVSGAAALKAAFPDNTVLIFIRPPSFDVLEERIRARGNVSEEELAQRLKRARHEMEFADQCDYQVVNPDHDIDHAIREVTDIVRAEAVEHGCL